MQQQPRKVWEIEKVINCYTCYKCTRIENKLYCPFFSLNPCHRGEHKIIITNSGTQKTAPPRKIKLEYNGYIRNSYCYRKRDYIFEKLLEGESVGSIADDLNIPAEKVDAFLRSVCNVNKITYDLLREVEVVR